MESLRNLTKNLTAVLLAGLVALPLAFARDVTEKKVDKMDSWQESFDINGKKVNTMSL